MPKLGQLVMLISPKGKRYLRTLEGEADIHTGDGVLKMADLVAAQYGDTVTTHIGQPYRVLKPTLHDCIKLGIKRQTQILYPKEIGYLVVKLGIGPGTRVIEAGSGSGSFTAALSWFAGETGRVYTYERRPEFSALNAKNLRRIGLGGNVEHHVHDIAEGFLETGVDALFLDVREPWLYVPDVAKAVMPGAPVAFLLPTINQVSELLLALEAGPFDEVEVVEILVRRWKTVPDRMRPEDRMIAHTGFLTFARRLEKLDIPVNLGTRERKQAAARKRREAEREAGAMTGAMDVDTDDMPMDGEMED